MINLSFTEFFLAFSLIAIPYLVYVLLRYYKAELRHMFSARPPSKDQQVEIIDPFEKYYSEPAQAEQPVEFKQAEELEAMLTRTITSAAVDHWSPKELLDELQGHIRLFPLLDTPMYRAAIAEKIVEECQMQNAVQLSIKEVELLWKS